MELPMCGSRKYPDPHHGGNWKFQGGGVRGSGKTRGDGGQYHFVFDQSWNIASYRPGRVFLGHILFKIVPFDLNQVFFLPKVF